MSLEIDSVSKSFRLEGKDILVVDSVSLRVEPGEAVALLGPSGCGKSTLLSLVAGFYPPDSGSITTACRVSLMGQDDMLLPWKSVLDNVCLPQLIRDKSLLPQARQRAQGLLPQFGLEGFGNSLPGQLSGGMRQRAALLRTVMDEGELWLLDEPFARLDALTKEELQLWLHQIRQRFAAGMLLVTHDIEEALTLSRRVYLLSPRPGRIIAELAAPDHQDAAAIAAAKAEIRAILRQHSQPPSPS